MIKRYLQAGVGVLSTLIALSSASAQQTTLLERSTPPSSPHVHVSNAAKEEAEGPAAAKSATPMTLDDCIAVGFGQQPALDAARASLNAAHSGKRALDKMIIPRLFRPDLGIRREQACHGVTIASAGLSAAEWETRYAITRNFYTVQYIDLQDKVVTQVLSDLNKGHDRALKIFNAGGVDNKITKVDLEAIKIQIAFVSGKKSQVVNGREKAFAALREAMGVGYDYPLTIVAVDLSAMAVRQVKKDKVKDKDEHPFDYHPVYSFNKADLIQSAIANRGEVTQAASANRVMELEAAAQGRIRGYKGITFGMGSDAHAKPIPTSVFNNEYRPGAIGIEIPPMLAGRMKDRVQRAWDLNDRAVAVVEKTTNLVSLDVEAQYFKWLEAVTEIQDLSGIQELAQNLPKRVQDLEPNNFTGSAVIQANMTSIMVRTQLNDALHMHALALAGLERATAGAFRVYPVPAEALPLPKKN